MLWRLVSPFAVFSAADVSLTSESKNDPVIGPECRVTLNGAFAERRVGRRIRVAAKGAQKRIQPEGAIEQIYVDDFATLIWEILRLRRYKTVILNSSRRAALQGILEQLLSGRDYEHSYQKDIDAEDLARSWFDNKNAQARVAKLLRKFQMDEGAIEAEAFRLCSEELERLERILTALEFRRDRALRFIAEYRQLLSKQLRQAGDRILEHDDVPRLVAVAKRSE
jgi:type IV secretory pathway VirB4 component